MKNIVRNVAAVLIGLVIGATINGGIVSISSSIVPLPEGIDPNNIDSIKANMHLYQPIHFLFPFLAHALGTLAGAIVAASIAVSHKLRLAMIIGILFLFGGITMSLMVSGPIWFIALDLIVAYLPMAWLGNKIAQRK